MFVAKVIGIDVTRVPIGHPDEKEGQPTRYILIDDVPQQLSCPGSYCRSGGAHEIRSAAASAIRKHENQVSSRCSGFTDSRRGQRCLSHYRITIIYESDVEAFPS